jgi:hypothetical protein
VKVSDKAIKCSLKFIDELIEDQQAMIDTINQDHPDFISRKSDEYECWKLHDLAIMKFERIKRQLLGKEKQLQEAKDHIESLGETNRLSALALLERDKTIAELRESHNQAKIPLIDGE